MTETELAYAAGFFDGEGSITICANMTAPRSKNVNHTMRVSVGNTDPTVIRWLREMFGGGITFRMVKAANTRDVYQWAISTRKAMRFLEQIRPYSRMKHRQIDLAIEFQKTKKRNGPGQVPDAVISWRISKMRELRALNSRVVRIRIYGDDELGLSREDRPAQLSTPAA